MARMSDDRAVLLLDRYRVSGDRRYRNEVVEAHLWLAEARARRLQRRAEAIEDLVQVAVIGVLHAADRFESDFGVMFRTFAAVTADGELRRHYRSSWRMRVPRAVQELSLQVEDVSERLTLSRGAVASLADVADGLHRPLREVEEAFLAG